MKKPQTWMLSLGVVISTFLLIALLGSCQEEEFSPALTKTFSIQSIANGATYTINVGLPENYFQSNQKYATLYVLDGEEDFEFVANQCQAISSNHQTQNVVVVSIGYGRDRSLDYTPTKVSASTGGGAEFLGFIKTQLIPTLEREFRVDTTRHSRVILGHSYGGLFGACVFTVDNQLFGNYLLLSPSIWFDNEVALLLEKAYRTHNKNIPQLVFMGIGELENAGRMQAPFEAFYQTLRDNYANVKLSKNHVKNLDHMGSKNPNIIKGLDYYFSNR